MLRRAGFDALIGAKKDQRHRRNERAEQKIGPPLARATEAIWKAKSRAAGACDRPDDAMSLVGRRNTIGKRCMAWVSIRQRREDCAGRRSQAQPSLNQSCHFYLALRYIDENVEV